MLSIPGTDFNCAILFALLRALTMFLANVLSPCRRTMKATNAAVTSIAQVCVSKSMGKEWYIDPLLISK